MILCHTRTADPVRYDLVILVFMVLSYHVNTNMITKMQNACRLIVIVNLEIFISY